MAERLPRQHLGEVGTDGVRVFRFGGGFRSGPDFGGREEHDRVVLEERVALAGARFAHDSAAGRRDEMLHLHGFDHRDLLAWAHKVAVGDVERDDRPLKRRGHRDRSLRSVERGRRGVARIGLGRLDIEPATVLRRGLQEFGQTPLDEARVDPVGGKVRMRDDRLKEGDVGRDAGDAELAERALKPRRGGGEIGAVRDDLGDERVERRARAIARIAERIDAHARARGHVERGDAAAAGRGLAGLRHRFEIDARLNGRAARLRRTIEAEVGEARARRDPDLRRDETDAERLLGDGVLDLEAGIGLDEGKPCVVALRPRVEQELERAEAVVRRSPRDPHRRLDDPSREAGVSDGLGATSTSFWLRRWIVHSRSPKCARPPWRSPRIWTSICRALSISRSA